MRGKLDFSTVEIFTCAICSCGREKRFAVSALDSEPLYEVILASFSPGGLPHEARSSAATNAPVEKKCFCINNFLRAEMESLGIMGDSLFRRPGASVRRPPCNWQEPVGTRADWSDRCVRRRENRGGWRRRVCRRIR